jgi:hypothetical protein
VRRPRALLAAGSWALLAAGSWALLAAGLLLAGCGATRPARTGRSKVAIAQATHEYPSPQPPPETVAGSSPSAVQAVRSFATAYINWTTDTVTDDMRALAARSIGQARSALELAAAQTASDYELKRGGISNSGQVEAVAPLPSGRNQYVVVTQEQTTATNTTAYQGLRPAWHVAIATVSRLAPGAWVLSGWQPES